jgi:hypothetical protein
MLNDNITTHTQVVGIVGHDTLVTISQVVASGYQFDASKDYHAECRHVSYVTASAFSS